jgi:hypothetical protein
MPPAAPLEQGYTSVLGLNPSVYPGDGLRSLPERQQLSSRIDKTCPFALDANAISNLVLAHLNKTAMVNAVANGGAAVGSASARPAEQPLTTTDRDTLSALAAQELGTGQMWKAKRMLALVAVVAKAVGDPAAGRPPGGAATGARQHQAAPTAASKASASGTPPPVAPCINVVAERRQEAQMSKRCCSTLRSAANALHCPKAVSEGRNS